MQEPDLAIEADRTRQQYRGGVVALGFDGHYAKVELAHGDPRRIRLRAPERQRCLVPLSGPLEVALVERDGAQIVDRLRNVLPPPDVVSELFKQLPTPREQTLGAAQILLSARDQAEHE